MATVYISKPGKTSREFIRGSQALPRPQGYEGKELTSRLKQVTDAICEEPIQRLIKSLEQPNEERHKELQAYIDSLRSEVRVSYEAEFTESVLDTAWKVWESLKMAISARGLCLEVPDASPGNQNNFMYVWSKGDDYFECEIFGTGEVEFFYRNRNSGKNWGEETTIEQQFSRTILDKAALFAW